MEVSMDKLPKAIPAKVTKISCERALERRLKDFGMITGTQVLIRYKSSGGGVTAFTCRGAVLALRTNDLKGVQVQWGK